MYYVEGCTAVCTCTMIDAVQQVANGPQVICSNSVYTSINHHGLHVGNIYLSTDLYCIHVFCVAGNFGEVYNPRAYVPERLRYSFGLSICPSVCLFDCYHEICCLHHLCVENKMS